MKKALLTVAQFLLFLGIFALGSFLHPFNLHHWATTPSSAGVNRYFVPDGLLLAIGTFLAIVIVQAVRKRTCNTTWTIVAFLIAIGAGYALKFGFVTPSF
jgi:xanthine/uracil permease